MNAVMVVEDEQLIAKDIADTLTKLGYQVTGTVSSAEACVASAATSRPDLVLMDIHLQGELDGIDAARMLREQFDIPVVFLSAYADEGTVARAKQSAPLGYLLKPFRKSELRSAVEVGLFRHQMERQLRERERWFSTTLRAIGDAVIAVDAAGKISFMNGAAEKLVGCSETSAKGHPLGEVCQLLNERTRESVPDPIQQALARQEVVRLPVDTALVTSDRELPVEDSVAPIVDERGERLGAVLVMRDMTEDRRTRQQIAAADRLASLGTVAAGIAHEINNPLTYILGNVGFLAEELDRLSRLLEPVVPSAQQREVADAVSRLAELISEVDEGASRVSRIVADLGMFGRRELSAREGDVIAALDWALRVSHTSLVRVARIQRNLQPVPSVRCDETKLGQIFLNMLLNAAHAMQDGDPTANELSVGSALEAQPDGVDLVRITIQDTGCGMTPEVLDRIFDPFFTTKPVGTGTGLGLSVCHGVVKDLGGSIQVSSEPGRGSTFTIRLPVASPEAARLDEPEPRLSGARGRVLIVDDDARVLGVLDRMLGSAHDVVAVGSAREALEALARGARFDVILCDLLMPDMSGIDLYRVLEQRAPELARRMIFLSGGTNTSFAGDFLQEVPNQALEKPPTVGALLLAIDRELVRQPSFHPLPSGVVPRNPRSEPN